MLASHCYARFRRCGFRPVLATQILFALFSNVYHAYAAVVQKTSVIRSASCLPYYFPTTTDRLPTTAWGIYWSILVRGIGISWETTVN